MGFYALASSAVVPAAAAGRFRRNMPDPVPVVVLGRLAIATAHHRRGLGRALFQDAAMHVIHAADAIGIRGLVVHALSGEARDLYPHLGLEKSPLDPMTLMVTVADLRAAVERWLIFQSHVSPCPPTKEMLTTSPLMSTSG